MKSPAVCIYLYLPRQPDLDSGRRQHATFDRQTLTLKRGEIWNFPLPAVKPESRHPYAMPSWQGPTNLERWVVSAPYVQYGIHGCRSMRRYSSPRDEALVT
jgi:hypothetical protein